ncbi:MAG: FkbM family methyltransferase [Rhizomicrobium sp.]
MSGGTSAVLGRMIRWQATARLWRQPLVMDFVSGTKLVGKTGMTSVSAEYYSGLFEFRVAGFMLHALAPGERLVDVGANVGVFAVMGAGVADADVIACEPSPAALAALAANIGINNLGNRVEVHKAAIGDAPGILYARLDGAAVNEMRTDAASGYGEVPVMRLDDIVADRPVSFLKIDVVGFEHHVLRGAPRLLANPALKAVALGCLRRTVGFGSSPEATLQEMTSHGFTPVQYDPVTRKLERLSPIPYDVKVLFVRNFDAMAETVRQAPRFSVNGRWY